MKLCQFQVPDGGPRVGVVDGDTVVLRVGGKEMIDILFDATAIVRIPAM